MARTSVTLFLVLVAPATLGAQGEQLYGRYCAYCHGARAGGARGPALELSRLARAADETSFIRIVQQGIPDTEMPPSRLSDAEVRQILAYLKELSASMPAPSQGDAGRGAALFRGKAACLRCHLVYGEGGRLGPELSSIGLSRSASHLRTSILEPEAELPNNFAQYRVVIPVPDNFLMVRVRRSDGKEISGIRLNEDPFTIQVRDLEDRLHSFSKAELRELRREPGKSPMPSYRDLLTTAELDDVIAYLLTLRGWP